MDLQEQEGKRHRSGETPAGPLQRPVGIQEARPNSGRTRMITEKLGADGILVKEVMLRDIVLPPEYAKGLEGLLLREQENERMTYDIQIKEKQVRTAELEAEAQKAREVKQAEGQAQVQAEARARARRALVLLHRLLAEER
jgi:regulator of protease activity HflC (stomatin/prohibitin superfamily)